MNENLIRNKEENLRKIKIKIDTASNTILTHSIRHNDLVDEYEILEDEIETLDSLYRPRDVLNDYVPNPMPRHLGGALADS